MKNALAIYIHWPFCTAKCPYCDFNSHVRESVEQERWKHALLKDLAYYDYLKESHHVTSIFFGGGTPSLMAPDTVAALIDSVAKQYQISDDIEITLEANPTSVEAEKLKAFKAAGVNRVSMGIQALNDADLQFLGRKHSASEALKALEIAQNLFERMTFDLIYARPKQSLNDWKAELSQALRFAKGHLSLYQLTIEENTQFHQLVENNRFQMPEESLAADMYHLTHELTQAAGLPFYEVSNYAAHGQESRHNLSYWRGDDYIGIGPGAHGRVGMLPRSSAALSEGGQQPDPAMSLQSSVSWRGQESEPETKNILQRTATQTIKLPEKWLIAIEEKGDAFTSVETLSPETILDERILMGLRIREGIFFDRFKAQTGKELLPLLNANKLDYFLREGYMQQDADGLRATQAGMLVLNHITHELLSPSP